MFSISTRLFINVDDGAPLMLLQKFRYVSHVHHLPLKGVECQHPGAHVDNVVFILHHTPPCNPSDFINLTVFIPCATIWIIDLKKKASAVGSLPAATKQHFEHKVELTY